MKPSLVVIGNGMAGMRTVEELRKCAWPTWDELKGSTVVVSITIVLLGVFCYAVDTAFYYLVRAITL